MYVPYGPLELRDSCMQINNITSIKACIQKALSICQNWPAGPVAAKVS